MQTYTLLVLCMVIFLRCSDGLAFNSRRLCTMRAFSDPHIETCNAPGTSVLCFAPGIQTYLDIFFLRITVLHTVWRRSITVITEVLIDFKSNAHPHTIIYTYRASGGTLPTHFEYKADSISARERVILKPLGPHHVRLIWPYRNVSILINNWRGRLYQITMTGPRVVMNTGIGMLIQGCPGGGRLPRIVASRISRARARAACLANKVPALDMGACIFDVRFTGEIAIAGAAGMAAADKNRMVKYEVKIRRGWPIEDELTDRINE